MVGESNQNVLVILIDALSFAEFEISEFEIARVDCTCISCPGVPVMATTCGNKLNFDISHEGRFYIDKQIKILNFVSKERIVEKITYTSKLVFILPNEEIPLSISR